MLEFKNEKGSARASRAILGAPAQDFLSARRSRKIPSGLSKEHRPRVFGEGAEDSTRGRVRSPFLSCDLAQTFSEAFFVERHSQSSARYAAGR
jgi:hypothetical protein